MQITTDEVGEFLIALGEQMLKEEGVCAGAILDTPSSGAEVVKRMTDRGVDQMVADRMVKAAAESRGDLILEWIGSFGDIELPN